MILHAAAVIFGSLVVLILGSWMHHQVRMIREIRTASASPYSHTVSVNGRRVTVYIEGEGKETLVFMAGAGTSAPVLDFKPLWTRLTGRFRTAVLERSGYGFSGIAPGIPRDINSLLEEARLSLQEAQIHPPYILVPHSMSALIALYWARMFPHEVKAVIGLDPAVPETYDHLPMPPVFVLRMISLLGVLGITRWVPAMVQSPVLREGSLSEKEQEICIGLAHRRMFTVNMIDEIRYAAVNSQTVLKEGVPKDTPMLFFISDGKEVKTERWRELLMKYINQAEQGRYQLVSSGHYIHHHEPQYLAQEITDYVDSLPKS